MGVLRWTAGSALGLTVLASSAGPVAPQGARPLPPLLPEAYEIALARTAAPASLSDSADVYVLRRGGHVKVRAGTNGAACMVSRDHPESLYPICYDPEAARSILQVALEQSRLRESGIGEDSVGALVAAAIRAGRLGLPTRTAIAYMMSRHQVIYAGANGRRVGAWQPHLMIYMPNATRRQLAMAGLPSGDLTLSDEGTPTAHFVVMTREWAASPPLPAVAPRLAAEPSWVCPGDEYRLRWSGDASAQLTRETGGLVERSALRPDARFVATAATVLRVTGNGGVTLASDTISLHPARMEHEFTRPSTTCAGRLAVASMAVPPSVGSDAIRPRRVTNRGARAVTITHRGVTARLEPGASTDAFNGLPFTGDWGIVLDTGVTNDRCPAGPDIPAPPGIDVLIETACAS